MSFKHKITKNENKHLKSEIIVFEPLKSVTFVRRSFADADKTVRHFSSVGRIWSDYHR